jgi:hypothetical protein
MQLMVDATGPAHTDAGRDASRPFDASVREASSHDGFVADAHRADTSEGKDASKHDASDGSMEKVDSGVDSGKDSGVDAGKDSGKDSGVDSGKDSGLPMFVVPFPSWDAGLAAFEGGVWPANQVMRPGVPDASYASVRNVGDLFLYTDAIDLDGGLTDDASFFDATPAHQRAHLHWNGPGPDSILFQGNATVWVTIPESTTARMVSHLTLYAAAQNSDSNPLATNVTVNSSDATSESFTMQVPDWSKLSADNGFILVDRRGRVGGSGGNAWSIFGFSVDLSSAREVTSIKILTQGGSQLYVYGIALW